MKKTVFALLRTMMLVALVPVLSVSLVACDPENGEEGGAEDTASAIAVTGLVGKFGSTYADISGYANLGLLPVGSGNPVIGVELVEARAESSENAVLSTSGSLIGNIYTVSFRNLSPATEYKYRSFVTYGGITSYGNKYKTFTTKEVVDLTSDAEVSDIKATSAVLSASVQTEGVDAKDNVYVGFAWAASKDAICADGNFESRYISVQNVKNGAYSVSLNKLSGETTYYYASFTLIGNVYVFTSVKEFTTEGIPEGAVDLGLSVLWASCNVGATSPEEYGDYFAWGETTTKSSYSYSNSVIYCFSISELESCGIIDADGNLTAAYDAATANLGSVWRMPTLSEIEELRRKCSWSWTTQNGVKGYKVTGPNGNSIFLPAAGYRSSSLNYAGSHCFYWSATSDGYGSVACYKDFPSGYYDWGYYDCCFGLTVRPVSEQ